MDNHSIIEYIENFYQKFIKKNKNIKASSFKVKAKSNLRQNNLYDLDNKTLIDSYISTIFQNNGKYKEETIEKSDEYEYSEENSDTRSIDDVKVNIESSDIVSNDILDNTDISEPLKSKKKQSTDNSDNTVKYVISNNNLFIKTDGKNNYNWIVDKNLPLLNWVEYDSSKLNDILNEFLDLLVKFYLKKNQTNKYILNNFIADRIAYIDVINNFKNENCAKGEKGKITVSQKGISYKIGVGAKSITKNSNNVENIIINKYINSCKNLSKLFEKVPNITKTISTNNDNYLYYFGSKIVHTHNILSLVQKDLRENYLYIKELGFGFESAQNRFSDEILFNDKDVSINYLEYIKLIEESVKKSFSTTQCYKLRKTIIYLLINKFGKDKMLHLWNQAFNNVSMLLNENIELSKNNIRSAWKHILSSKYCCAIIMFNKPANSRFTEHINLLLKEKETLNLLKTALYPISMLFSPLMFGYNNQTSNSKDLIKEIETHQDIFLAKESSWLYYFDRECDNLTIERILTEK